MQKLITALIGVLLLSTVGCTHNKESDTAKSPEKDACSMCPGPQTAKADGTCAKCGMKSPS